MVEDTMMREQARSALAQLRHIIDDDPERLSEELAEAVRRVVRMRDQLVERRRAGTASSDDVAWLDRANGILSLLVGAEYPIKAVHWDSICQARDTLREMLAPV